MNVSEENAVAYIAMGLVLITAIICYTYLLAKNKIDPPDWLGKKKTDEQTDRPADS